jgi:hypothetical protein
MSSNFGEIIKKLYFLVWWKARQRATHAIPHLSASRYRTFSMCWTKKWEWDGAVRSGFEGGISITRGILRGWALKVSFKGPKSLDF